MAARRHLPVIASPAKTAAPAATEPDKDVSEPLPWHWIPLGTVVSVLAFALLAQGAAALSVKVLSRVYGRAANTSEVRAVRALHPTSARLAELFAGTIPVITLCLSIGLGGYFIGRYGARTNARHGTLSGALTGLLFWAVTGRLWTVLLMVPLGMLAGWASAHMGVSLRAKALI